MFQANGRQTDVDLMTHIKKTRKIKISLAIVCNMFETQNLIIRGFIYRGAGYKTLLLVVYRTFLFFGGSEVACYKTSLSFRSSQVACYNTLLFWRPKFAKDYLQKI